MKNRSHLFIILLIAQGLFPVISWSIPGVTDGEIVFRPILPLERHEEGLGNDVQVGLEPLHTHLKECKLNGNGIFSLLGNVGIPNRPEGV